MTMWIIIFWVIMGVVGGSLIYLGVKVPNLLKMEAISEWGRFKQFSLGLLITLGVSGIIILCIDFVNALVCIIYIAMIWATSDILFWSIHKIGGITFEQNYVAWGVIVIATLSLGIGWYLDHHVWQTNYNLVTPKNVPALKVAMFADSHIGTTFDENGFARHLQKIQAQNPDILVIVGDYVDDGTTKQQMIASTRALGKMKTKYGIYFVFGNHDKGYYGPAYRGFSADELVQELTDNGITVLRDESILIADSFYLIGRRDFSEVKEQGKNRQSIKELIRTLDDSKYMIVLDHQPVEYEKVYKAGVDLVLNGHTHGGQLFPFNQVGKWIGANDLVYGHEKRGKTDFIVTSGISDWAIKFKTGTKSEFVIINIKKGN